MGLKFLYDTNILIYHLNNSSEYSEYFQKDFLENNQIFISSITRMELLSYPDITDDEKLKIENMLEEFEIIPLIKPIEDLCIEIRKKKRIKLPDSIILATAKYTKSELITQDKDLFKKFNSL